MGFGAVVGGALGLAGSVYGANKASKSAAADRAQNAYDNKMMRIQADNEMALTLDDRRRQQEENAYQRLMNNMNRGIAGEEQQFQKDNYDQYKRELTAKHMFRLMDPLPDAWKLTDWCLNSGIHTEILTAAGTVNRELVVRDKIERIREHINPYWTIIPTFKGSQKAAFAHKKAVLIDDRDKNIDCWVEAGGIGILHTTADNTIKQLNDILNSE